MQKYEHQKIESKWQKKWEKDKIYQAQDFSKKPKFYCLVMFPYVSGNLHVGHWYNFAPADVFARFKKMQGYNVLSPIGFDAFGLPAENAAIKDGIHPRERTKKNISKMRQQLKTIGAIYDWSRQVNTSDPNYYKWTQWLFLQFYKHGLAYKKKAPANWCISCKTILANEQVVDGRCERCNGEIIRKEIDQWLLKITDEQFIDRLIDDLDKLDWPEKTKIMQKNWIGRSFGANLEFKIKNSVKTLKVFTTRPDTIFGATYMVVCPEHEIISYQLSVISNQKEVFDYIKKSQKKSDLQRTDLAKEKTGVEIKGIKAINPANQEEIPIWVADYVLPHYGTGAIMAVPDHDDRDKEFAEKYNLKIKKTKLVDSKEVVRKLGAKWVKNYKLRDWLISRQRYWGAPIPIIYCEKCGQVPVLEKDLPIELPDDVDFRPTGESPLERSEKFHNISCPKCGAKARRESDTMDTFVCSSWYYFRYLDSQNKKDFADKAKIKKWMPVDMYIGGAEHTVLHLLYSRFFAKFLKDFNYIDMKGDEPFKALRHQGMILGPDGQKMSKSKGNVIDPDEIVEKYGADTLRMYLCFMAQYDQGGPWNPKAIIGMRRFLGKIWRLKPQKKDNQITHKTIQKITQDLVKMKFNTAIACLMEYINSKEYDYETLLKLLAPFAPHIAEELWHEKTSIHLEDWPKYNPEKIKNSEIELVIQVNGKVRAKIKTKPDISEKEALKTIKNLPKFKDLKIKKTIFVPGRLINLVV
ncbi:MAG: leucine--tRNA ligase [Candidatus Portnoybacteria bacterium CG23_combo_of_CG06-09_8_20_14_all_37_13]|uniref:Leucine--tRNA ligase n=1 Tax=Candidatus Portnoybacteria bacterium CG23_combo_of_CG06-09_8_20_14_all_37_13 TaxID=1974819 RepID=A0A2G9YEP9_9BACT|nr:MAG: leucine--tRNA ligase [Candidatus Portnoybacteria bacterium CG23_combo_of_CG06-09_8_20_14_all_37_13]